MEAARLAFPSLHNIGENQQPVVYLDGAGGSQTPREVSRCIYEVFVNGVSNIGGKFKGSRDTEDLLIDARAAIARLIGAEHPASICFGANMTSLTQHMANMIAEQWCEGDHIILTDMDHAANRTFWAEQATSRGVSVSYVPLKKDMFELDFEAYLGMLTERTVFVALPGASNLIGTITALPQFIAPAKAVGAQIFVDAVHALPHAEMNVKALDVDFLAGSMYKLYGPHVGFIYGRVESLARLKPKKVYPATNEVPRCFETGTLNFACLAGVKSAVEYIESLSYAVEQEPSTSLGYEVLGKLEESLSYRFLSQIQDIKGVNVIGSTTWDRTVRTPTFALTFDNCSPQEMEEHLGGHSVYAWAGNMYAERLVDALGLSETGGVLRLSFMHYNTKVEVDRVCKLIENFLHNPPDCLRRTYSLETL